MVKYVLRTRLEKVANRPITFNLTLCMIWVEDGV